MITCPTCHASVIAPYDDKCPICRQPLPELQKAISAAHALAAPEERTVDFLTTLHLNTPRVWAMPLIVGANVLVFVAMVASGASPMGPPTQMMLEWGANFGPRTLDHQQWRMITSAFLHFGIFHIAFNMWVLWQLGDLVERLVGNIGFLVLYFISALGGSLLSLLWNPLVVSAGASGAVFGVCGALLGFIVLRGDTIPLAVLKQLRGSMLSFLGYNLVFGLAVSGIDVACHLGGLLAGFVCGLIMSQPVSPAMVGRRWKRNLACIGVALLLSPVTMAVLPAVPAQQLNEINQSEFQILKRFQSVIERHGEHPIPDVQLAGELDRDVLTPWQQLRGKVNAMPDSRFVDKEKFQSYFALREQSLATFVEGLRTHDKEKIAEFEKLWQQANRMAQTLSHH